MSAIKRRMGWDMNKLLMSVPSNSLTEIDIYKFEFYLKPVLKN